MQLTFWWIKFNSLASDVPTNEHSVVDDALADSFGVHPLVLVPDRRWSGYTLFMWKYAKSDKNAKFKLVEWMAVEFQCSRQLCVHLTIILVALFSALLRWQTGDEPNRAACRLQSQVFAIKNCRN